MEISLWLVGWWGGWGCWWLRCAAYCAVRCAAVLCSAVPLLTLIMTMEEPGRGTRLARWYKPNWHNSCKNGKGPHGRRKAKANRQKPHGWMVRRGAQDKAARQFTTIVHSSVSESQWLILLLLRLHLQVLTEERCRIRSPSDSSYGSLNSSFSHSFPREPLMTSHDLAVFLLEWENDKGHYHGLPNRWIGEGLFLNSMMESVDLWGFSHESTGKGSVWAWDGLGTGRAGRPEDVPCWSEESDGIVHFSRSFFGVFSYRID